MKIDKKTVLMLIGILALVVITFLITANIAQKPQNIVLTIDNKEITNDEEQVEEETGEESSSSILDSMDIMEKARRSAHSVEAIALIRSAQTAYQALQLDSTLKYDDTVCFSADWLIDNGYFEEITDKIITGSVLVEYDNKEYKYTAWYSNGIYVLGHDKSGNSNGVEKSLINETVVIKGTEASNDCNGAKGVRCVDKNDCKVQN